MMPALKKIPSESVLEEVRKERHCLMCRAEFSSAWSGERVCQKCKSRSNWREGVHWPSGGRRS